MSRGGRMVIVPTFHEEGRGFIPRRVEILGSITVNNSLTQPSHKNGTSKWGENRIMCASPVWDIWRQHCSHSPQGDGLHQGWVGYQLSVKIVNHRWHASMRQAGNISKAKTWTSVLLEMSEYSTESTVWLGSDSKQRILHGTWTYSEKSC